MRYSVDSDASSVGEQEEDPNIPKIVPCCQSLDDDDHDGPSVCSEISDETMRHYGLKYDCKPDIAEIAHMTLEVNYGDLANMAGEKQKKRPSLVLDPAFSTEDETDWTWSQLLDNEAQPSITLSEETPSSHCWSKGYQENCDLEFGSMPMQISPMATLKIVRRPLELKRPNPVITWASRHRLRPLRVFQRMLFTKEKMEGSGRCLRRQSSGGTSNSSTPVQKSATAA